MRRTKILATLGPATDDKQELAKILQAGVNVVRINFSHGDEHEHLNRINMVRAWAQENNTHIGILIDLQGPKIRISSFKNKAKIELKQGDTFILDTELDDNSGTQTTVGISYKNLPNEVKTGNILLLDDGRVTLEVTSVENNKIITKVAQPGVLTDKKGINLKGGGLSVKSPTAKDKQDMLVAAKVEADYIALSFVASGDDIRQTKKLLQDCGSKAEIIAKIERAEALQDDVILDIIKESAGIMVARGDLGIEIGDAQLPAQQKRLIKLARSNDIIVITATQMLESMINSPIPTRAEVFDVANAVLDGTDVVMLSAETAVGKFPENAVKTMHDVCIEAEKDPAAKISHHRLHETFSYIDKTIAMSSMYAANHLDVKLVVALTQTGSTARWMSRISSNIPIYAVSDNVRTLCKVTLYRGVYPCVIDKSVKDDWSHVNASVVKTLITNNAINKGELLIITKGMYKDKSGGTNVMKIIRAGDDNY